MRRTLIRFEGPSEYYPIIIVSIKLMFNSKLINFVNKEIQIKQHFAENV